MRSRKTPSLFIIGLGNPGREYAETRHNAGFLAVQSLSQRLGAPLKKRLFRPWETARAELAEGEGTGERATSLLLARPLTYMNRSGIAVAGLLAASGGAADNLLVIYDTLDLPPGEIRVKSRGSSGGQRGVESIIDTLGTQEFLRIAVGIGRPAERSAVVDWVLSRPEGGEAEEFQRGYSLAADAAAALAFEPVDSVMSRFNGIRNQRNP